MQQCVLIVRGLANKVAPDGVTNFFFKSLVLKDLVKSEAFFIVKIEVK